MRERARVSRMNRGDYENVSLGKPSPRPLGQFLRIEPRPTSKTSPMARAALVLLTLALLASLSAIVILYFQVETCTGSEAVQWKACLDNITTLTSEMQMLRSHLESPRVQTLEYQKISDGLEAATVSRLKGHLETMTVLPVTMDQVQSEAPEVGPETPESPTEEDLEFGKVTEPPGGPIEKDLEFGRFTKPPGGPIEKDLKFGRFTKSSGGPTKKDLEFGRVTEPPVGPMEEDLDLGGITETPEIHAEKVSASGADMKMLKDLLETMYTSYNAVRDEYMTLLTLLSKGWKFYNGNLYYFYQKYTSWNKAETFCESWGSHLTSVTSVEEQEFLIRRAKGFPYWIGLTTMGTEGSWHWVDGTLYNETNSRRFWIGGQPQQVRNKCVEMQVKTLRSWSDRNCWTHLQGICKKALKRFEKDSDVSQRTELD